MFIVKLLIGVAIIIGMLYGVHRMHRQLSGRSDSTGLVSAGIRRARNKDASELDQFIADYHARGPGAVTEVTAIDPATDHKLGLDLRQPLCRKVAQGPGQLMYLLLKSTLSDHHLFPNARIADFIQDAPATLGSQRVDFVLCNRGFEVAAIVDMSIKGEPVRDVEARTALFRALNLRYVRLETPPLPRPQQIRSIVLG